MNLQNYKSASCETAFLPLDRMVKPVSIEANLFFKMKMIKDLGYIYPNGSKSRRHVAMYECPLCGKIFECLVRSIENEKTKSCGCLWLDSVTKHGLCQTKIYSAWSHIKDRCYNIKDRNYKNYGGRGIFMCDEWKNNFKSFYDWSISHGYSENLTIDRTDNDMGYSPENCRWVTKWVNTCNRRNKFIITYNGKTMSAPEWGKITGVDCNVIRSRIQLGWSIEKSLFHPVRKRTNKKRKYGRNTRGVLHSK